MVVDSDGAGVGSIWHVIGVRFRVGDSSLYLHHFLNTGVEHGFYQ